MRKTFKKIAAAVMAAATLVVGTAGMSASAVQYAFNLGRGGSDTVTANKANRLAYASVSVTGGNLSNSAYMYFCLKNSSGSSISSSKKRTGNGSFTLDYTTTTPSTKTPVKLQGNAGYYGAEASGSFTP